MNCNDVRENLVAYIHGELEKDSVMKIHQHLSTCEACVQEEIAFRKTSRILDQFQFEALPENFDSELEKKLTKVKKTTQPVRTDFRRIVYAIAATIIIMIGIQFFGYHILQSNRQPVHFKDFPTTQAVFKTLESRSEKESQLKNRFLEKYLQSKNWDLTKLKRE